MESRYTQKFLEFNFINGYDTFYPRKKIKHEFGYPQEMLTAFE